MLTDGATDIASAALVFSHDPAYRHEGSSGCIVEHISSIPPMDRGEASIPDTSSKIQKGRDCSVPMPAPPGPSCVPSNFSTHALTCSIDPDSAIAIGPAGSPPLPPLAAPMQQRGVLVHRAKPSAPPSALPMGPAVPTLQAQARQGHRS